jgi:hypothetical protein
MNCNFEIVKGIYLVQEGLELDLHNNYDFKNLKYLVGERKVILSWERSKGDWVGSDTPKALSLEFTEVSEFRFMPRDSKIPFAEDDCVSTIGYWVDEDWAKGVFMLGVNQKAESHWLTGIEFMSGTVIALQAKSANAKLIPNPLNELKASGHGYVVTNN